MVLIYTNLKDGKVTADFEVKTSQCVSEVLTKPKEVGVTATYSTVYKFRSQEMCRA
jgi:hypothetical protein